MSETQHSTVQRERRTGLFPIPRSIFLVWVNLAAALIVAAIGLGLGFSQGMKAQEVILFAVVSAAVLLWALNYVVAMFESRAERVQETAEIARTRGTRAAWHGNRVLIVAMAL